MLIFLLPATPIVVGAHLVHRPEKVERVSPLVRVWRPSITTNDLRDAGEWGDIARMWTAPLCFGVKREAGSYDLTEASRLDYVLRLAEKKGMHVILCLMNHGQLICEERGARIPQWSWWLLPQHARGLLD